MVINPKTIKRLIYEIDESELYVQDKGAVVRFTGKCIIKIDTLGEIKQILQKLQDEAM